MNLFSLITIYCDAPKPWGAYIQKSASTQIKSLVELDDNIMFYLVIILFGVAWIMVSIIRNYIYTKSPISYKYLYHRTLIELILTITPALILILIAFLSFKWLDLMDEVIYPSLTVFVEGNQLYWSYQYPDFTGDDDEELELDIFLLTGNSSGQENSTSSGRDKKSDNVGETRGSRDNDNDDDIEESQFYPEKPCDRRWYKLSFDEASIGQGCDTCNDDLCTGMSDAVYYCEKCHAISCKKWEG